MSNIAQTLNVYYTASQYVDPSVALPTQALVDEKLIYPIIKDSSQFQVGLVKAKVPLDTIPLTSYNIPLKAYEIGLRKGNSSGFAYVPQLNSTQANFLWKSYGSSIIQYTYNVLGGLTQIQQINLSSYLSYIYMFVVDDYSNLYCIGSNILNGNNTSFFVFSNAQTPSVYYSDVSYTDLVCISIDRSQKIYLASQNSGVQVFSNVNSNTGVNLTLETTINVDFDNNPLINIATVCSDQTTIIGYNTNYIQVYNDVYTPIASPNHLTEIVSIGNQSAILHDQNSFVLTDVGVANDSIYGIVFTSDIANNTDTNVQAFQSTWSDCPHVRLDTQYVLGIGLDNLIYQVQNNSTATPVEVVSAQTANFVCGNRQKSWYLSQTANTTLCNFNTNSTISLFADDFAPPVGNFNSFDVDKISGKILGISNNDNKLYSSNLPVLPIQLFIEKPGTFQMERDDINLPQTINKVADYTTLTNNPLLCCYSTSSGFIVAQSQYLTATTGNVILSITDFNFNVLTTKTVLSLNINNGSPVLAELSVAGLCVVNGLGEFYFYDESTLSLITNATITGITPNVGSIYSIACQSNTLVISNGLNILVYTYNSTTNIHTLVQSTDWVSLNSSILNVWSMWINPNSPLQINVLGSASTLISAPVSLYQFTFADITYALATSFTGPFYNPASQTYVIPQKFISSGSFQDGLTFIKGNQLANYMIVPSSEVEGFDIFYPETSSLVYLGTIAINYQQSVQWNGSSATPLFFSIALSGATGLYTYTTNIPTNLDGNLLGFAMSATSRVAFATDLTGLLYQGNFNGTSITDFAVIPTGGSALYSSISTQVVTNPLSQLFDYNLSTQTPSGSVDLGLVSVLGLCRNVVTGEFIVCTNDVSSNLISYPASSLVPTNWTTTVTNPGCVFVKNSENLDSGPANIYSYQTVIDAINSAFVLAFNRANKNGASLISPPSVGINFQNGLVTLNYDSEYVNSVNGVLLTTNGILFNNGLNNLIRFNSNTDTLLSGFNLLYLVGGTVSPYSVQQSSTTITSFNLLDKILFNSTTIYVSQNYYGNNQVSNTVTDIDIDTSQIIQNTGQWLLYQPNFLRPFLLASNNAIDRIQLQVYYQYIDGTTYPLLINPGSGWNAKIDFVRKFQF